MSTSKIFNLISPFTLAALVGVFWVVSGFIHMGRENNALYFIFGFPAIIIPLLAHLFIQRISEQNAAKIWIVEGILLAIFAYLFYYKW